MSPRATLKRRFTSVRRYATFRGCYARQVVVGAQRGSERPIPERALREALVNAIMHRDYRMPRALIVALAIDRLADTFKVVSSGGFPEGADESRLLATRSRPRNRVLADAMRVLGTRVSSTSEQCAPRAAMCEILRLRRDPRGE